MGADICGAVGRTRELAKTVDDLEIASQPENQVVANMSHELRIPLAAILGYAELMQEGLYEPRAQNLSGRSPASAAMASTS